MKYCRNIFCVNEERIVSKIDDGGKPVSYTHLFENGKFKVEDVNNMTYVEKGLNNEKNYK